MVIILIRPLLLLCLATLTNPLPLSTTSRWIIDESTRARVKLSCVNWAAHLEPMLAEGLDKRPVGQIVRQITAMGFNCVRLTWATHMVTRYRNLKVDESLKRVGVSVEGVERNNPGFVNLTVGDAQRSVIEEIGKEGLMVVLDNHVSRAGWCCRDGDGNGFFGDRDFNVEEWVRGLNIVAKRYKHMSKVVGMSLRNELRGPHQNISTWYEYMQKGAKAIHKANSNLLVIISGLHYDLNLSFLTQKPLKLKFKNKLVYEVHQYAFSLSHKLWSTQSFTDACEKVTQTMNKQAGFLLEGENAGPLFVSEFGIYQEKVGRTDNLFLGCLLAYLAEKDLDWSIWALQGSYYIRNGVHGLDETFGMLNINWSSVRNPGFGRRLHFIQPILLLQDPIPNSKRAAYNILYHPTSGGCITANNSEVHVIDCQSITKWNYKGNWNPIRLMGTKLCLLATGNGNPVTFSEDCTTQWELVSNSSKIQVANKDQNGKYLCLELDSDSDSDFGSRVVTKECSVCLEGDNSLKCRESLERQWFKLVPANA